MLQIKQIRKQYKTGNFVQKALDGVSLNLRENEFVAILGPSGSGKTTLLNIIGGLDRYDSGDLVINGISTKKYKDRDWDSYRNHTIGFVFQSYNLIPHQTILSNVELALTISGISRAERKKRAKRALEQVGLGEQSHKKPNQMSGGQMQRVAIARALVNDPDILLADEPTGALDSETSVQVMELLKEVAKDRLVVMVTHNPELAEAYATRIVNLKDGKIKSDTDPFEIDEKKLEEPVHRNMGKASMSFLTALSLSFHNLQTKKTRTLLTSFAGSIGIIGIALILSLSNGVNAYIKSVEEETLSEYPLQIQSTGMDIASMMFGGGHNRVEGAEGEVNVSQMISSMFSKVESNDLASLKRYFESGKSDIEKYTNAIEYSYNVSPQIFRIEEENDRVRQVNPDRSFSALGIDSASSSNNFMSMFMSTDVFFEMPENADLYQDQYDVRAGRWPKAYNECVLVLTQGGSVSDFMLYTLGLRNSLELDEMIKQFIAEEKVDTPVDVRPYAYEEFLGIKFKLVNGSDYYEYDNAYNVWKDKSDDETYMQKLVQAGEDITIVGVVQASEDASATMLNAGIGYPASLTKYVIKQAASSPIVRQQLADQRTNVLTGNTFGEDNDQNHLDMASLFSIDENALQNAFGFDENALKMDEDLSGYFRIDSNTMNLSDMIDLDAVELDMPQHSGLNLGDIMEQLDLPVSTENIQQLGSSLMQGYGEYAAHNPSADYSRLDEYFMEYLRTPEAQKYLQEGIRNIVLDNVDMTVSSEQLTALIQDIMEGYQEYVIENHLMDPSKFSEYLSAYLQTPEAQQRIAQKAAGIFKIDEDITVSPEQIETMAGALLMGYQAYAAEKSLPDPAKINDYFMDYLRTPEAQQRLTAGMAGIVNVEDAETQISGALGGYMQQTAAAYSESMAQALESQITSAMQQIMNQISKKMETAMQQAMQQIGAQMKGAFNMDPEAFSNAIQMNMDEKELAELLRTLMSAEEASYDNNLKKFGYANLDEPGQIDIYPRDFESKAAILDILDNYNSRMEAEGMEEKVIAYTDLVGTLMSSVTDIVDTISYVLVAFVAISLVVSSIMIGVITYISVLERKKEIGILRAIGASKRNISQVFDAETFIIGLCAGVIGIGLTLLLLIPGNMLIHSLADTSDINASLPVFYGFVLIMLSIILTLVGGLIPSQKAAKSDPVAALRSE